MLNSIIFHAKIPIIYRDAEHYGNVVHDLIA